MSLGERGRLLRHRPDEDDEIGEEWQGQKKHHHYQYYDHHHRSYGGLPAELDVVDEEEDSSSSWRKNSPASITHYARVALIAGVLLVSAAMVANTLVRPPLPLRRGTSGSSADSSSGSSSDPIGMAAEEVHGAGRGEEQRQQQQQDEDSTSSPHGMSDLIFRTKTNINPETQVGDGEQGDDDATTSSSRSSSSKEGRSSRKRGDSSSSKKKNSSSGSMDSTRRSSSRGGGGGGTQGEEGQEEQQQPNVIFILIDDVGMNDIGHRSTDLQELAPFMDSLSSEGVRLTKYYTNHLCTPSRVSL